MAQEYKLAIRELSEYENYSIEQLEKAVEDYTQMVTHIRDQRALVQMVLRDKQAEMYAMSKVAAMSDVEKAKMLQVLSVDTITSKAVVNAV